LRGYLINNFWRSGSRFTPDVKTVNSCLLIVFPFVSGQRFTPDSKTVSFCLLFFCGALPHTPVRKIFEKIFPTPFKNFYFFVLVV
jgi:hypothetical protein